MLALGQVPAFAQSGDGEWRCQAADGGWQCERVGAPADGASPDRLGEDSNEAFGWDWVPLEQLDAKQRKDVEDLGCCGAYVPPERDDAEADLNPEQAATTVDSANAQGTSTPERLLLSGDTVTVTQGKRQLQAERLEMDRIANTADISGNIAIRDRDPDLLITGDSAFVDQNTGAARVENARVVIHDLRVRAGAQSIIRDEDQVLTLNNGEFTRCEPASEEWKLRGSSFEIDPNTQQGRGRHVVLEVADVPVLYLPYLRFPVGSQRQSGFLFPTLTSDDVAIPYYLNLAPNYDMTLVPRWIAERGSGAEIEARHLSQHFETVIGGAYLPNGEDGISDSEERAIESGELLPEVATEFDGEDRWVGSLQQTGGMGSDWYSLIDYTKVSDYAYFNHLDTTNLEINRLTHLLQAGEVGYRFPNWQLSARVEEYQSIVLNTEEPYQQKPQLKAAGSYRWNNVVLDMQNNYTQFDHRQEFISETSTIPRIIGDRLRLDYSLGWDQEWLWGYVKPKAMLKSLHYQLDEERLLPDANAEPSITVPQATLDMGVFFERDGSWFGDGYLQTFEPQLFYFYSDFESHEDLFNIAPGGGDVDFDTSELTFSYAQLFRDSRFAGGDRIEDANQLSVGLTTRFLGRNSGVERFRASIGQIYYFEDRLVSLNGAPLLEPKSEIAGQFSAQLTDSLRFNSDVLYAPETNKVSNGSIGFRYFDDDYRIVNLSYRFNRQPEGRDPITQEFIDNNESQGDLSFIWPVSTSWNVIGRAFHDFTNQRELDSILGLEYTSCCYRLRLVGRRWLDNDLINRVSDLELEYDRGIFFEFQLRGLGSLGRKISDALSDGIFNFDVREENLL